jgi:hypothetical protein
MVYGILVILLHSILVSSLFFPIEACFIFAPSAMFYLHNGYYRIYILIAFHVH